MNDISPKTRLFFYLKCLLDILPESVSAYILDWVYSPRSMLRLRVSRILGFFPGSLGLISSFQQQLSQACSLVTPKALRGKSLPHGD